MKARTFPDDITSTPDQLYDIISPTIRDETSQVRRDEMRWLKGTARCANGKSHQPAQQLVDTSRLVLRGNMRSGGGCQVS